MTQGLYFSRRNPYLVSMRVVAMLLLGLVAMGCASAAEPIAPGGAGSLGAAGTSSAGSGGSAGAIVAPVAGGAGAPSEQGGAGGTAGSPEPEGGAGGELSAQAGAAGDAPSQAGQAGQGGAPDVGPQPGELFSECVVNSTLCQTETCGPWAPAAGQPLAYLCTFGCWSLQGTKMAPDVTKTAQCQAAGGLCLSPGGSYYPVCVPHEP